MDYGFLLTVEKAKQAVEYTGVAEYASKALETTNNVIINSVRAQGARVVGGVRSSSDFLRPDSRASMSIPARQLRRPGRRCNTLHSALGSRGSAKGRWW